MVNTGAKKGVQGGIGQVDRGQSPYVTFYIEVDDPQEYLDKVVGLGGSVKLPVTTIPNMVTFAQFTDPEGNVVGLVKSAMPQKSNNVRKAAPKKTARRK